MSGLRKTSTSFADGTNRMSWVLTKYDDCLVVLKDAEAYSSKSNAEVGKIMGRTVIEMDGKEHIERAGLPSSRRVLFPGTSGSIVPVCTTEPFSAIAMWSSWVRLTPGSRLPVAGAIRPPSGARSR